ncbi:MAG: aminopeptidase P family protein [Bacteroidales bacterium]|nr:aminopeptidase P family protein [Bacteroidales bacterium]
MAAININDKIATVRELMEQRNLDALVVMTEDPHGSEYPAKYWKFREFLTGFNGSAGTLVITAKHACLWTDSRYYIQATKQLRNTCIELFKYGLPNVPDYVTYLTDVLPSESTVGVDGFTISYEKCRNMKKKLAEFGIKIDYKVDIIDEIFAPREPLPNDEVIEVDPTIAGLTRMQKVEQLREIMRKNNVTHYIATALDDIAWISNLRGNDIEYNPVFYAYMIIGLDDVNLYIDPHKLTSAVSHRLMEDGFKLSLYDHFEKNLGNIPANSRVFFDPSTANTRIIQAIHKHAHLVEGKSSIELMKSQKSPDEINHIYSSMIRDGVALVKFLHWLEDNVGKQRLTELDVAQKLIDFRSEHNLYMSESFEPISAYGSNAAIVHYSPSLEGCAELKPEGLLLLDTGAQYADGTTDITRTIPLGPVSNEAKKDYTLVLKGHIALANAMFPEGTRGVQLDILARQALWQVGEDYGHGTGHGVGYCLNVHEGPQRIAKTDNGVELRAGMITSNEPGVYREGKHGIRIENLVVCEPACETEFGKFLKFRTLTLCPIDTRPILIDLLTDNEKKWLNNYHRMVRATLVEFLSEDSDKQWLINATNEI